MAKTEAEYEGDLRVLESTELTKLAMSQVGPDSPTGLDCNLAGEILERVAKHGGYGGIDEGITPLVIGLAIRRIVRNYTPKVDDSGETTSYGPDTWHGEFLVGLNWKKGMCIPNNL